MAEFLSSIFVLIIGIASVAGILFIFGRTLYLIFDLFVQKATEPFHYIRSQINPTQIDQILTDNIIYYRNLSMSEKIRFASRLKKFMNSKEFIGRENLKVSKEMAVLISASAIQITFGLKEYILPHFSKIFIYPKEYYSRLTKKYHKGDVNLSGGIAFSWDDFKEGYAKQNDNYNLGLHEMAHALRFNHFKNNEYDRFFAGYFEKWSSIGMQEFNRIKKGEISLLREYAAANINEFFSVCVEYFFESPQELKDKIPDLYKHMCILLNQNPLEKTDFIQSFRKKYIKSHSNPAIDETPIIKVRNSIPGIFIVWVSVFLLFLFGAYYFISISKLKELTHYLSSIAFICALIYIGKFKVIYFYSKGIKIKPQIPLPINSIFINYENLISVTLTKNKLSELFIISYVKSEQIIIKSFPCKISNNDMVMMEKVLSENKISLKISNRNVTLEDRPKERSPIQ